ncbi:MAG: excinuclease ABC subunit UvrB [Candidatus Wildermuthbacteria bacterium]|nr:excinuclease ABC subunit UvrB [Candidatus Wildermuthbacteria bacterium]
MNKFQLVSSFRPTGDQPQAIAKLTENLQKGLRHQVLLGVTGSGKTYTMASLIAKTQRPALVISPNKTLAAQLYQEFKEFFPGNGVHYFVSYYDYYQPEAYIPQSDTYIEKDAKINEVLDRLRHEAVQDVLTRKDAIVVASVSCIYNIGSPEEYQRVALEIQQGQKITRRELLKHITSLQYQRNDIDFTPGTFRAHGDAVEIFIVTGKHTLKVEFSGDKIERVSISEANLTSKYQILNTKYLLYPAKFWVTPQEKLTIALSNIRLELQEQLKLLKAQNKLVEAQRLEQRAMYDLEMIEESGYCHGIENYSRHFEFRDPGTPPFTLLDYFGEDALTFIDESHLTLPQLKAMSVQDKIRKQSLIQYGFRLPSSQDNRPLTFSEFFGKAKELVYVSATPGEYETDLAMQQKNGGLDAIVEQVIRPTGLTEPVIEIRKTKNHMQDLIKEIQKVVANHQRALVVTITKRLAEDIADFLAEHSIKTQWIHSELKTLERPALLEDLRRGNVDVLVGVNLLREGLDLPEVSLVAILDADKEGFLRNATTLIQTMGRAARHPAGKVILYADSITLSMKAAIQEVERRRNIQEQYNKEHGITPQAIVKAIREWPFPQKQRGVDIELSQVSDLKLLEQEMKEAASSLDFERAAQIRDLIKKAKGGIETPYANHNISKKGSQAEQKKRRAE